MRGPSLAKSDSSTFYLLYSLDHRYTEMAPKDTSKTNGTSAIENGAAGEAPAPVEDKIKLLAGGRPDFDAHKAVMDEIDAAIAKLKSETVRAISAPTSVPVG